MNILAEAQKEMNNIIDENERLQKYQEFLDLYFKTRNEEDKKWYSNLSLEQRKKLHNLIVMIYKLKNRLSGFKCEVLNDRRTKTNRPIIFAPTHVGKFDIEVGSVAICESHYYLLSGDYEHLQGLIDGYFLRINGVFFFNELVKDDRKKVTEDMIKHLQNNGNLMYFIEGTWNITPNLPVLPCYWGIVDVAKKGNAIIVPMAVEQYGKTFKVNIGENFDMLEYDDTIEGKTQAINDLRDTLATLKYEIWETVPVKREEVDTREWEDYKKKRFREWSYFNEEYIKGLIYKPKGVIAKEEAFSHLEQLIPKKENAFLLNRRLH